MPRYHFHVHNGVSAQDKEGLELPDLEAAKASACQGARDLMCEDLKLRGGFSLSDRIDIVGDNGAVLHVTRFGGCADIRP